MRPTDEVELIRRQIHRLRNRGESLSDSDATPAHEIVNWVRDVCEIIRAYADTDSNLNKETDKLWRAASKSTSVERARDLLDALEWRVTIDSRYTISENFQRAVNIAIKDQYFHSWPFKVILASASVVLALLVGGTLIAGVQVQGLLKNVVDQQRLIDENATRIDTKTREFASQVEDKKFKMDEIVRAALAANNSKIADVFERAQSDTNKYVTSSKEELNNKQTEIIQKFDHQLSEKIRESLSITSRGLEENAKKISDRWSDVDKKLIDELADAKEALAGEQSASIKAVKAEQGAAIKRLGTAEATAMEGLKAPLTAIDNARKEAVSAVKSASITAKNEIVTLKAETEGIRNAALRSIQGSVEKFEKDVDAARVRMAEAIARFPNDVAQMKATMSSIDRGLDRYRVDLAMVVSRLNGDDENKTRLGFIVDFLGVSFWLMVGSLGVSFIALFISAFVSWSRRRSPTIATTSG